MQRVTHIDRSLSAEGIHSLLGFAALSTHNELKSLASRLMLDTLAPSSRCTRLWLTHVLIMFVVNLFFPAVLAKSISVCS